MSTKFHYIANDEKYVDAIAAKKADNGVYYSLGKNFDQYAFRRFDPDPTKAAELLEQRIRQLRDKYDYIRLWFSGGKDSTLVLSTAVKHNIHIDEIVIVRRFCKNNLGLYTHFNQSREIEGSAVPYLKSVKSHLNKTKISFVELDDKEFELPFRDPKWYTYTNEYFFGITYTPNMFYRYVNPKLGLLKETKNRVDLCGGGAPAIWQDEDTLNWHFCYSDTNFVTVHSSPDGHSRYEDFLVSSDMPELVAYYVNTIIESYIKDNKTSEQWSKNSSPHLQRLVRDRSTLYELIKDYKGFQFPKTPVNIPFKEYFWQVDPKSKKTWYDLINRYLQTPMPTCLKLYIENTDWNAIKAHRESGWVTTKTWAL